MEMWIEGENRSTLKKVAIYLIFSFGFFMGLALAIFVQWSDKILAGG